MSVRSSPNPFLAIGLLHPVKRLRGGDGESNAPVKTAARNAGKEVKAVFQIMLDRMEKANG